MNNEDFDSIGDEKRLDTFKKAVEKDFMVKFNNLDADDEDELDEKIDAIKNSDTYRKYERIWNRFADLCETNNILARADWTCCNTCGNSEIDREKDRMEKSCNKKYVGYVFYHLQESDRIYTQCQEDKEEIKVWLGWGYFDNLDEENDTKCIKLAEKIYKIALDAGCDLDYTDISQKLEFKATLKN
ncbi:hypothetical protein QKU48_gp0239 [Fadolivirus algeromassiliense]|jgi:hypothetical protein|uniref:DUF6891 domain-containing protein n=1 Tax=Fadolivirus FV1/VV64 TaxID=3070911 RepID=A0A7D3V8L0_9VIRU|nr:hypothetical protein QKU48_gp0239 [Fadolivirus algeromassiliense]QKF93697.1 hypothetical protein Fadolivirus_1_239 [Fadolivirus FV1/VV64]